MANNDFINSVVDKVVDEGAAAPAPAPQQGGFNPVIEAAAEQVSNVYKAREYAAALQSLSSDPDKYAEYMKLGEKTGFDPAFVGRNYEAISRDAALDDITKLIGYNQKLGQWYVEGDNPNAIKVDELRHLSGLSWLGASAVQSFKSGRNTTALADLRFKDLMGTATGEDMSEITRLNENREPRTYGADTSFQRGWSGAFQQIPIMAETAVGSVVGAAAGGAAGAGTALVAGQLGPQVALPEELITVPGAAAWGARAGWITGGMYSSFRQQTGLAFDEFVQLKDETGQPLDRDVARIAALAAGGVGAGLEFVGFQSMAKIVPGMDKVMGSLSSEGVKAALMRPTIRAAFKNFAMNVGKSMTTETITEVAQEAMTMLAGELAKEASGQAFAPMSLGDAHERISEKFVQTLETMAVMGPFLSSTRFGSDISRARQATRNQAVISQIIDSAKRDELLARLPDKAQAAVKAMAEGGDMENVFIDPAVMKEYFQDPNDLQEFIDDLDIADEFRDAEVIGRDVQIPVEVYYAKIAATNFGVDTQRHVKFSPEDMSSHVADVFNAAWAETQSALMDEVQRREREEYGPKDAVELVHQDVKSRLMNAGNTPDHSERIALMYSTFFRVLSKDTGQDAGDLYAKYGLDFRRVMPGDNMRGVDALSFALEKIRRGHVPAMAKALQKSKGPSMLDAIKKRGGVIDTGGELAAMGANKYIRQAGDQSTGNMFGKGDNKFGADETLLSLWEDGYFPEFQERPDLNVLYDAMAEELAGTPRYSVNMDASGDKRMQSLADIIALSEDLQRLGLDPSTMSDDEIITELDAITNTDPDTAALYQRVKSLPSSQSISTPKVPTAEEMESLSRVEDVPLVDARGTNRLDWEAFDAGEHPGDLISGFGDMPVVGRREDGEYIVFDGHHRIALALEAGETSMPMHVIDVKAYDPANAGRASTPDNTDLDELMREFSQEQQDGPEATKRGSIQFYDGRTIINTFEHANLSTLLHETGHFFLEVYRDAILKDREGGPDNVNAGLQERWAKLVEFLDIKDEWNIGRDSHEKFARSFETYLFEGKAPSNEVAGFMARFRSWLTFVYKTAKAIGAPINDEIRAVFDRMLATDDEIKAAQFSPNFTPAFKSEADALAAGMTEAQWRDYKEAANNAVDRTRELLTARMLDDVRQQTTKEYREARKAIRDQVEALLRNQPIYQAINYLKGGKIEGPLADLDRMFLDKEAVEDIMGDGAVFKLPRSVPPVYRAKGGVHPDIIAELFGFKSGHDLLKSMLSAEPIARAINNETDALMKEKFGDLLGDTVGRIREAQNAIANDATGELLNREMEVFMKKGLVTSRVRMADAKRIATEAIRSKPVREAIRVKLYQNATLKAAEEAQRAVMAGKWKDAVAAKQRQILSHYMTQAALQVDKDTQSAVNYLNRFAGRSRPKNIDPEYLDQIEQLLERFDMRKAVSLKQAQRRASLASWIEAQEAAGNIVTLPDAVRRDAFRKSYKEMTVEDLMTVRDAVQNIEHLGRLKSKLLANKERREYQDAIDSLTASVAASQKRRKTPETITPTKKDGFMSWARSMESTLVKIEQFFEFMDNGDINGPFRRLIWRPIAEAQQREIDMLADYTGRIFKTFEKLDKKRLAERITIEGVDRTFQRHNILAVALNMGSESNLDKMLRGEGWNKNPEILDRVVSHLNDAEWAAVQEVWDTINSLWPEIKAVQKRLTGVEPPKVESRKFTTPTGRVLTGGYYPMMYDPDRVDASTAEGKAVIRAAAESDRRVAANDVVQFENVYLRPETRHGFTKERAQEYTMPILFSVDGIARHINAVIHDVTHREALIDANKLLTNPFLRAEISSRYGKEMYDQIVPWLQNIAHDAYKRDGLGAVERFMRGARTHATIVAMGFRISNGIMQLSGFGPSLEVLIPSGSKGLGDTARAAKAMAGAMKDFLVSPMKTWDEIVGKSTELRSRSQTLDRDIRQALNDLTGRTNIIGKAQRFSMYHIGYMDRVVSAPTWLAAYRLHLQQYPTDEMGAREAGDRAVRMSQGAGGAKDLAAVQRSNELVKMLTMFYSYFSAYYNRQKAWGRDAKRALASGEMQEFPALLARQIAMTIVPAVLGEMLVGRGPDDDQSWLAWAVKKSFLYPFSAVPMARDIIPVVFGESFGDYTLSPVERTFNDGVIKPLQLIGDILDDETEVSGRKATRTVLNSAGLLIGLPTGQLSTTVNNVWLGLEQDDFQFRDLVLSRPEKR